MTPLLGENLQQLLEEVRTGMSKLQQWFSIFSLFSLHLKKTKFMVFGNHNLDTQVQIGLGKIDNVNVERVYEKNFCVILERKFCWKHQINTCKNETGKELCSSGENSSGEFNFKKNNVFMQLRRVCVFLCMGWTYGMEWVVS